MRQSNSKTTIGAGATEGFTQRAGLPVQPGVDIGSTALHRFKVQIARPNLSAIHGGVWAVTQEAAKAMLWLPRGYAVSLEEVTPYRAIFWDEAFLDHVFRPEPELPQAAAGLTVPAQDITPAPSSFTVADVLKLTQQNEDLRQCLENCQRACLDDSRPHSARVELVRDFIGPVLYAANHGEEKGQSNA